MRKLGISFALIAGVAGTAAAQSPMPWASEFGVNLNYTMTSIGSADITTFGIPSGNAYAGFGGIAGVYGVFPVNGRFAVEPSLGFVDIGGVGTTVTTGNASVRLLYSAWRSVYIGAGPTLAMLRQSGDQETTVGAQVGVGYRRQLTGSLQGRAELNYHYQAESDILSNEHTSSIGLVVGLGLVPSALPTARRGGDQGLWQWAMGIQGGYSHMSFDGGDLTAWALPGSQQSVSLIGGLAPLPGIAPIFVQIPVSERIALEPSFSYSSIKVDDGGATTASGYALGLRADYAFNKTVYAAVSADYLGFGGDLDVDASTGFGVAGGIRYPLVMGLSGRTELSWRNFNGDDAFIGDHTVTGITFAVTAPLR